MKLLGIEYLVSIAHEYDTARRELEGQWFRRCSIHYRGSGGSLSVRYLCWFGGPWGWGCGWFGVDWLGGVPAALVRK